MMLLYASLTVKKKTRGKSKVNAFQLDITGLEEKAKEQTRLLRSSIPKASRIFLPSGYSPEAFDIKLHHEQ